jgi:hypothetical protein
MHRGNYLACNAIQSLLEALVFSSEMPSTANVNSHTLVNVDQWEPQLYLQ